MNHDISKFDVFEGITSISAVIKSIREGYSDRVIDTVYYDGARAAKKSHELGFLKHASAEIGFKLTSADSEFINSCVSGNTHGGLIMLWFPIVPFQFALPVYMIGLVLFGFGLGIYNCVSWALMGDAIDYNEWKFGTREEGMVYSLHSFFRKLAQGLGPSVVLLIMGALGYVESLGTIGQSPETAHNMCWLVAGLYLFSAVLQFVGLAFIYNIDKKTLETMNAELAERHSASAEEV